MDSSITADNLSMDLFTLEPVTGSLPTGIKINYVNSSGYAESKDITALGSHTLPHTMTPMLHSLNIIGVHTI